MIKGAITVRELYQACEDLIERGLGDKQIVISNDDEGNGFHTLFCTFVSDPYEVEQFKDLFHDKNKVSETVILG